MVAICRDGLHGQAVQNGNYEAWESTTSPACHGGLKPALRCGAGKQKGRLGSEAALFIVRSPMVTIRRFLLALYQARRRLLPYRWLVRQLRLIAQLAACR